MHFSEVSASFKRTVLSSSTSTSTCNPKALPLVQNKQFHARSRCWIWKGCLNSKLNGSCITSISTTALISADPPAYRGFCLPLRSRLRCARALGFALEWKTLLIVLSSAYHSCTFLFSSFLRARSASANRSRRAYSSCNLASRCISS